MIIKRTKSYKCLVVPADVIHIICCCLLKYLVCEVGKFINSNKSATLIMKVAVTTQHSDLSDDNIFTNFTLDLVLFLNVKMNRCNNSCYTTNFTNGFTQRCLLGIKILLKFPLIVYFTINSKC